MLHVKSANKIVEWKNRKNNFTNFQFKYLFNLGNISNEKIVLASPIRSGYLKRKTYNN